jgi:hypothetical protein
MVRKFPWRKRVESNVEGTVEGSRRTLGVEVLYGGDRTVQQVEADVVLIRVGV